MHSIDAALHPSGVAKSSTSFGWGNGGNVTSARWKVTLCDPIWHVSSRSGEAFARTAMHDFTFTFYRLLHTLLRCPSVCLSVTLVSPQNG